jgi:hypothetical protein
MFIFLVIVNATSPITGIGCLLCLIFLFFETAFGICLGCKVYSLFHKDKARYCAGQVCEPKSKQDIQKISGTQLLVVVGLVIVIFLAVVLFNDYFSRNPYDLFGLQSKGS